MNKLPDYIETIKELMETVVLLCETTGRDYNPESPLFQKAKAILSNPPAAGCWRTDIENAPRDGTGILIRTEYGLSQVYWNVDYEYWFGIPHGYTTKPGDVTHWAELTEVPGDG